VTLRSSAGGASGSLHAAASATGSAEITCDHAKNIAPATEKPPEQHRHAGVTLL
jgi:hypothetical protein